MRASCSSCTRWAAPTYLNALYNRWREVPGARDRASLQGYIDEDVYEAARAFTGWSIEDGAGLGANQPPARDRQVPLRRFTGTTRTKNACSRPSSCRSRRADGRRPAQVLDIVAYHPARRSSSAASWCGRLISDDARADRRRRGRGLARASAASPTRSRAWSRRGAASRPSRRQCRPQAQAPARAGRELRARRGDRPPPHRGADQRARRQRAAPVRLGPPTGHPDDPPTG